MEKESRWQRIECSKEPICPNERKIYIDEYFHNPAPHDLEACNALKQYHEYQDKRDTLMFEQIPFKHGSINGRRLATPSIPYRSLDYFASINSTTVELMKQHWRCVKD